MSPFASEPEAVYASKEEAKSFLRGGANLIVDQDLPRTRAVRLAVSIAIAIVALAAAACSPPMPHADHNPRHGGVVMMLGNLHYEVILDPKGVHRVYFSDAIRRELSPSVASDVTITVSRDPSPPETLHARISPDQKYWVAEGRPVPEVNASGRVAFTFEGRPYWIDLPFGLGSP